MKDINATITLAYVEEDNKQRVIFRVIPLCTREGAVFHAEAEDFPDEGSLRIVPDKREQSTFKERMREIGGLCAVRLLTDGKELVKVRQNRNYSPEQGENNQYAIYSDVICEFMEDSCLEVVDTAEEAAKAITAKVLLCRNKLLYGPVLASEVSTTDVASLKPFGNDSFLLHTIDTSMLGKHRIYWNPEATLNWRQRRSSIRKRANENTQADSVTPAESVFSGKIELSEEKKDTVQVPADRAEPDKSERMPRAEARAKRAAQKGETPAGQPVSEEKSEKRPDTSKQTEQTGEPAPIKAEGTQQLQNADLPLGTKLEILDSSISFEQQISRLAQPLSESANRLSAGIDEPQEEETEPIAHFTGTPIGKNIGKPVRIKTRPENVHHIVEQQMKGQRDSVMGSEMGPNAGSVIENPIDSLLGVMEYIWQDDELRRQAIASLLQNDAFRTDLTDALRNGGTSLQASAAAKEQLAEIEADRLNLLMQLDAARENEKKYREQVLSSAAHKRRDEVERLKKENRHLEETYQKLTDELHLLSKENVSQINAYIAEHLTGFSGVSGNRKFLSPVIGTHYSQAQLTDSLRVHMNESGFSINEDDTVSLLVSFALYHTICLRASSIADAKLFATVVLESFGLENESAFVDDHSSLEITSLLKEDLCRTPTVSIQTADKPQITAFGHKTILLALNDETLPQDTSLPYPVISVPTMVRRSYGEAAKWNSVLPAAISSFDAIRSDSSALMSEAEKWFSDLKRVMTETKVLLSDAVYSGMKRFVETDMNKVRGGFLMAADIACCQWIVPVLRNLQVDHAKLKTVLSGLPYTLEALNIR